MIHREIIRQSKHHKKSAQKSKIFSAINQSIFSKSASCHWKSNSYNPEGKSESYIWRQMVNFF